MRSYFARALTSEYFRYSAEISKANLFWYRLAPLFLKITILRDTRSCRLVKIGRRLGGMLCFFFLGYKRCRKNAFPKRR